MEGSVKGSVTCCVRRPAVRQAPLHLPLFSKPLAKVLVREEHMQQTALAVPPRAPTPRVPGWTPRFADYRSGLDQVIEAWDS